MTVASAIGFQALRESNIIGISATPTAPQAAEALSRLNNLVSSSLGWEVGEPLQDWPVGLVGVVPWGFECWTQWRWSRPTSNVRLVVNHNEAETVTLPARPDDGARLSLIDVGQNLATYPITLDADGRRIEGDTTLVLNTDGESRSWLYRADLGDWIRVDTLLADSELPFPPEFDDAFITMLALRLNPRYGRVIAQETVAAMERSIAQLRARYSQTVVTPADIGVRRPTVQVYNANLYWPYRHGWMG